MPERNRAILLTPPGAAAIAVVRVLGPGVAAFLKDHFSKNAVERRCVHGELHDGDRIIDDPVVVVSRAGRVADLNVHGGPWVVRSVLELARSAGFDVVNRTDLPLPPDAMDGDDALESEVLAHLPLAKTEPGLRTLLAQPQAWRTLRQASPPSDVIRSIMEDRALWWLLHPPRVAIVGAPNVGKSTLANQLFARDRSITADLPGTTRDWVGEIANIDGLPVMLVDTPGLRETPDLIEREAIERSTGVVAGADAIVLVLDATRGGDAEQLALFNRFQAAIHVVNKVDRAPSTDWPGTIRTIATLGQGIAELRKALVRHFGCENLDRTRPRWWTERQRAILERTMAHPTVIHEL